VGIMSGHLGGGSDSEILLKVGPQRANIAVDIGKIITTDPHSLKLIQGDIDRFHRPNPARVR
jgi:hypothetical protein